MLSLFCYLRAEGFVYKQILLCFTAVHHGQVMCTEYPWSCPLVIQWYLISDDIRLCVDSGRLNIASPEAQGRNTEKRMHLSSVMMKIDYTVFIRIIFIRITTLIIPIPQIHSPNSFPKFIPQIHSPNSFPKFIPQIHSLPHSPFPSRFPHSMFYS